MADNRGRELLWATIDHALRTRVGESYTDIAARLNTTRHTVARRAARLDRQEEVPPTPKVAVEVPHVEGILTREDIERIASLEDLLAFFKVDQERWQVRDYRVNKWEQASKTKEDDVRVTPLYQVRANLVRSVVDQEAQLQRLHDEMLADIAEHAPPAAPPPLSMHTSADDPVMIELAVHDPHVGMLAWGKEVGKSYDTDIATQDYAAAVEYLLQIARIYPVERILYVVGHDLLHVDTTGQNKQGGTTTAGTPQDIDSRLERMFTAVRKAVVRGVDLARTIAPVDVMVVPGNHDQTSMYRMGEVLNAWYRNDDLVDVRYSPMKRKFYSYGKCALMLTHGEEYRRKRDNLAMIFATEAPAEMWVASEGGIREVHTGHNHVMLRGGYHPTSEVDESRGIRTRSLPGLTPEDKWHFEQGYQHKRSATLLAYRRSGSVAGEHQFSL